MRKYNFGAYKLDCLPLAISVANLRYVTKNRMFGEIWRKKLRTLDIGLLFLICLTLILIIQFGEKAKIGIFLLIMFFGIVIGEEVLRTGEMLRAGALGERKALMILRELPKEFTIFNQVNIPFATGSKGFQEIDYIIVGPTGVFIVEVKNKSGKIIIRDNEYWMVEKYRKKNKYLNPLIQLHRQEKLLLNLFHARNIYIEVQGTLLFVHKKCEIQIPKKERKEIFRDRRILNWIKKGPVIYSKDELELLVETIKEIKF